ncbi:Rrf2 family transcriptional regulator [Pelagibacterium lentulum]|uniref:Rrf2 family transcriptional regulator n=2 Tax=Pelagibacterium lentulum TaxID=2029865 RepID=A0A916RR49_9HYPH|nr:Rrf2 family transcriptional regulator [Pelagibacterium lentulum]
MLHVLIHMDHYEGAATSEVIARMLNTNPVVVRRTMAGLRDAGYLRSEKGHNGGWILARPLSEITMRDVYVALGEPPLIALGLAQDDPRCVIEQAVNDRLRTSLEEAERRILEQFSAITLDQIAGEFKTRLGECQD